MASESSDGDVYDKAFARAQKKKQRHDLWVDKYTSGKFMDLLTNDEINRKVLTWLLSWDDIVFPQKKKVSLKPPDQR